MYLFALGALFELLYFRPEMSHSVCQPGPTRPVQGRTGQVPRVRFVFGRSGLQSVERAARSAEWRIIEDSLGWFSALPVSLPRFGIGQCSCLADIFEAGWNCWFILGLGSCAGDFVYFTLAVFGIAELMRWPFIRWGLWLFGTATLLYLSWRTMREVVKPRSFDLFSTTVGRENRRGLLATGVGLALASPTAILWFASIGGSVIATYGANRHALWSFTVGFFTAGVLWAALFAYSASAISGLVGPRL